MAKVSFQGTLEFWGAQRDIQFKVDPLYEGIVEDAFKKLCNYQEKIGRQAKLFVSFEFFKKSKSNEQLALYYSLCDIFAFIMNGGMTGPGMVSKDDIDQMMKGQDWWKKKMLPNGKLVAVQKRDMTVEEMRAIIDHVFALLAETDLDVKTSADIAVFWQDYKTGVV